MERMPVQRSGSANARVRSSACSRSATGPKVRQLARDRGRLRRLRGPIFSKLLAARGAQIVDQRAPVRLQQVKLVARPRSERAQPGQGRRPPLFARQPAQVVQHGLIRDAVRLACSRVQACRVPDALLRGLVAHHPVPETQLGTKDWC
jgi:hypothetical protein